MIRARAGRAIGYSTGYGIVSLLASIALLPLVFTSVGAGPYGVWLFLITIVQYFYYADLGVGAAVVHFSARVRGGDSSKSSDELLSTAIAWSVIACVLCVPAYGAVAYLYTTRDSTASTLHGSSANSLVALSTFAVAVIALRPFNAALIGAGKFVVERQFQFLGLAVRILGTLWACLGFNSLLGVALAETLALILPTVGAMGYVIYKNIAVPRISAISVALWRQMTSYSLRSIASTLASMAAVQGGTIVAGLIGTPSSVSYYNAALRVYMGIRNVGQWCTTPFQTTLSRAYVQARDSTQQVVRSATFGTLLLVAGASVGVLLVNEWLMGFWLGNDVPVEEIAQTLTVLLGGLVIFSLHGPLSMAAAAAGRPGLFFPLQLAWAVSGALIGILLGEAMGITGVALGMALPLVIIEPLYFYVAVRFLDLDLSRWCRECLLPVLLIVGFSGLVGLAVKVSASFLSLGEGIVSVTSLIAMALSALGVGYAARPVLPWRSFKTALSAEL